MKSGKSLFAYGGLTNKDKFVTALRITSKRFYKKIPNISAVLYCLLEDYSEERKLQPNQIEAVTGTKFSQELGLEVKRFFLLTMEDEALLVDYLNQEISKRYWRRDQIKNNSPEEAQCLIDKIVQMNLADFLSE